MDHPTLTCPPTPQLWGETHSPRIGGQGGTPGAIETILTAWLSSYRAALIASRGAKML